MQTVPYHLFARECPAYVQQDTDTATPRQPIPIYYIHEGDAPFCANTSCFCQRAKQAGALMYQEIAAGKLLLAQVKTGEQTTTTAQHTVHHVHVPLDEHIPEMCQLFGHSWTLTEHQDVKECLLCGVRGFCPGCTLQTPAGAQPFYCTSHTGRQVQP